ncbi:hypothetical protein [Actinomycetospora cinnamomea]|uniref:Uncharacterized protein n=1 Tax=Actinomycetospora cinnamomea TaxID=663609 RepID=A0A2U1F920_9PSEU|nr:hypothetical protein [Actinomycetospora cinnamomea]PVZ08639.1 hypothetical protein C8D89_108236 [Actinomycetospora cinnamomea]
MSSPHGAPGSDRDLDRAVSGAHADYHREIQQHAEPDGLVDDVVTYRMLAPHLMRTLLFLVAPTVLLLVKVVIDYLASMSTPDGFTDAVSALLGVLIVVLYLAGIASFFAPAKEPIAEHARLLENRGDAAASAYEHVRAAAAARRSPAEVSPSTVAGVPVLLFRQYSERAMLLVQPYGRDLYVGWTMWRSRSTATLLLHFLRDTFGRFAPAPRFSAELRAAATRALRESVHSLSREGVAVALQGPAPQPAGPGPATGAWSAPREEPPTSWGDGRDNRDNRHEVREPGRAAAHQGAGHPADPPPSGALPTAGPAVDTHGAWTGEGRDAPQVGVPADTDEGWGPPPRDRW